MCQVRQIHLQDAVFILVVLLLKQFVKKKIPNGGMSATTIGLLAI
jgi:hypothetical protein